MRYGRLIVINTFSIYGAKKPYRACLCKCDCGTEKVVRQGALRAGHTKSCGCLLRETCQLTGSQGAANRTHAKSSGPEYHCWQNMKDRCANPNNRLFHNYGGRGIRVCARWINDFAAFYSDMGSRPTNSHTIERINNDKGYSPKNTRWATRLEQGQNTRRVKYITFRGETKSQSGWAEAIGVTRGAMHRRLKEWPLDRALTEPQGPQAARY